MSISFALIELLKDIRENPSVSMRIQFCFRRMNIGWGTLRVAGGMAITSAIFESLVTQFSTKIS